MTRCSRSGRLCRRAHGRGSSVFAAEGQGTSITAAQTRVAIAVCCRPCLAGRSWRIACCRAPVRASRGPDEAQKQPVAPFSAAQAGGPLPARLAAAQAWASFKRPDRVQAGRGPGPCRAGREGRRRRERPPRRRQLRHSSGARRAVAMEDRQPDRGRRQQRSPRRKTRRPASSSASTATSRSSAFRDRTHRRSPRPAPAASCPTRRSSTSGRTRRPWARSSRIRTPSASRWSSPRRAPAGVGKWRC